MLRSFEAIGVNGHISVPRIDFAEDLNVITGNNGSGKTTILKLLWYLISGNLERIPQEMTFEFIELITTDFRVALDARARTGDVKFELRWPDLNTDGSYPNITFTCTLEQLKDEPTPIKEANLRMGQVRQSVFFPTFRRIEGGFSISQIPGLRRRPLGLSYPAGYPRPYEGLESALSDVSRALTVAGHHFVCSVSTWDIENLLTNRYADISQRTNSAQSELVKVIIAEIENQSKQGVSHQRNPTVASDRDRDARLLHAAQVAIANIRKFTTEYGAHQEMLLQPFVTLSRFIASVFADKGIIVSSGFELGEGREKIPSDVLSAGEKQILSFLVYNAFYQEIPIFIDEPENSLHVDWQRTLFPTLLQQKTRNQFIIATHSPFIYQRYTDKEIMLNRKSK